MSFEGSKGERGTSSLKKKSSPQVVEDFAPGKK